MKGECRSGCQRHEGASWCGGWVRALVVLCVARGAASSVDTVIGMVIVIVIGIGIDIRRHCHVLQRAKGHWNTEID